MRLSSDDHDDPHARSLTPERVERLISAIESLANTVARIAGLLEHKAGRKAPVSRARTRPLTTDRPITITPMVQAAVKRALARVKG